jgi:hypothetical protein
VGEGHDSAQDTFTGTFDEVSMSETVPNSLLALISKIENGPDIESQIKNGKTDLDLAISQLYYRMIFIAR